MVPSMHNSYKNNKLSINNNYNNNNQSQQALNKHEKYLKVNT